MQSNMRHLIELHRNYPNLMKAATPIIIIDVQSICFLINQVITKLSLKTCEKCPSKSPGAQDGIFKLIVLSGQQSKCKKIIN